MEFPSAKKQPEMQTKSYQEVQQVPGSERMSEQSFVDEIYSEQPVEIV
jgi:hypothetical protein